MNRTQLIEKLVKSHGLSNAQANRVVQTVVATIIESVQKNDGLSLTGFGSFKLVSKAARTARNPGTGETIKVGARRVPKFTPGAAFLYAVDAKRAAGCAASRAQASPLKSAAAKKSAPAKQTAPGKHAAASKR